MTRYGGAGRRPGRRRAGEVDAAQYAEKLGDVAAPDTGVTVPGARGDTQGRVIHNATNRRVEIVSPG